MNEHGPHVPLAPYSFERAQRHAAYKFHKNCAARTGRGIQTSVMPLLSMNTQTDLNRSSHFELGSLVIDPATPMPRTRPRRRGRIWSRPGSHCQLRAPKVGRTLVLIEERSEKEMSADGIVTELEQTSLGQRRWMHPPNRRSLFRTRHVPRVHLAIHAAEHDGHAANIAPRGNAPVFPVIGEMWECYP